MDSKMRTEPCLCGATDCPSCGRAQGYTVVRSADGRYRNPEPDESTYEDYEAERADYLNDLAKEERFAR
jgi:hypothetical protein